MAKFQEFFISLCLLMGMINLAVVGLVGYIAWSNGDGDFQKLCLGSGMMVPIVVPVLMGQLLFHQLHELKSQVLMILTHLGYAVWIYGVWFFVVLPARDALVGLYFFAAPFFAAPFLLTLWITACVLNGPLEKRGDRPTRSAQGPLVVLPERDEEDTTPPSRS